MIRYVPVVRFFFAALLFFFVGILGGSLRADARGNGRVSIAKNHRRNMTKLHTYISTYVKLDTLSQVELIALSKENNEFGEKIISGR